MLFCIFVRSPPLPSPYRLFFSFKEVLRDRNQLRNILLIQFRKDTIVHNYVLSKIKGNYKYLDIFFLYDLKRGNYAIKFEEPI